MAVHELGDLFLQPEVERGERRHRAGHADRVLRPDVLRDPRGEERAHVPSAGVDLLPRRRIGREEALGQAHAAEVEAVVKGDAVRPAGDQLRRSAPHVHDERRFVEPAIGRDPAEVQERLFLPGQEPGLEAVAPLDLAEERLAVFRVANGARADRERTLGPEAFDRAAVIREDVADARDCGGE